MHKLARAFAYRLCDKYQNPVSLPNNISSVPGKSGHLLKNVLCPVAIVVHVHVVVVILKMHIIIYLVLSTISITSISIWRSPKSYIIDGFEPHRRHCVVELEQATFILA